MIFVNAIIIMQTSCVELLEILGKFVSLLLRKPFDCVGEC